MTKRVLKTICIIALALGLALCAGAGIYLATVPHDEPDLSALNALRSVTVFLDARGEVIQGNVHGRNAEFTALDALPDYVPNAFIAIEDKRFYRHDGIDRRRIVSALWQNLKSKTYAQGASTITQQLVKNTQLSAEKTISRKVHEIRLARKLERMLSKKEILTYYLNAIYFGHNVYGIEAAAEFYFGKSAKDLTLTQAASLAAIINAPSRLSPLKRPEQNAKRRALVLALMYEQGMITKEDCEKAKSADLMLTSTKPKNKYYLAAAMQEARSLTGKSDLSGYRIETYLDSEAQALLERTELASVENTKIVLTDGHSRIIAAHATDTATVGLKRQPASTVKPLLVYAPAIEKGAISPASQILDEPIDLDGYKPKNYGNTHAGWISARQALADSNNVVAVKILEETGIDYAKKHCARYGLTLAEEDCSHACALGGLTYGVTLEELAQAHSALTHGSLAHSQFVRRIKNPQGRVIYSAKAPTAIGFGATEQLVTNMMTTCARNGTAAKLARFPFEIAAKTGTVGSEKSNTDAYAIASTTAHTLAVWYGGKKLPLSVRGGTLPCETVARVFDSLYRNATPPDFTKNHLRTARLDALALKHDHKVVRAPSYYEEKDTLTEYFCATSLPRAEAHATPTLRLRRTQNGVAVTINADRYAELCLARTSFYGVEVFSVARDNASRTAQFFDTAVAPSTLYTYQVIALFPDGSTLRSDLARCYT